jgi:hypothetical protein
MANRTRPDWDRVKIINGWLAYDTQEHNCAGGTPESSYMHEAHCGYEPIMKMDDIWAALVETKRILLQAPFDNLDTPETDKTFENEVTRWV